MDSADILAGFGIDIEIAEPVEAPREDPEEDKVPAHARSVKMYETMTPHEKLRLLSEKALDTECPWHLEQGKAYHFASYGDVDALTFLRRVAQDQRIDYAILSTWCMAQLDASEIEAMVARGDIKRIDFVVGEVFNSHSRYKEICKTLARTARGCGGRVLRCYTHMKVTVIYGEEYDCVIESSANVDTNPSAENTCITVDTGLADFYKEWMDGLPNFDEGWKD